MFGKLLTNLTKTALNTALLPIDIAKDVITLGGVLTDEDVPYTIQRAKKINQNLEDTADL